MAFLLILTNVDVSIGPDVEHDECGPACGACQWRARSYGSLYAGEGGKVVGGIGL